MKISLLRQLPTLILTALALRAPAALDKGWDAPFISGTSQTICYDIATESGVTYSAGFVQTTNNFGYVIAHSDRGVKIWDRTLTPCVLRKIVVAGSFVYACGYTPENGYDGVVVKLDKATGVPSATWADTGFGAGVRHFGNNVSQGFGDMVVSGTTVYVSGYYEVGTSNLDACIVKYDPNGSLSSTWTNTGLGVGVRTLAGSAGGVDIANALALDASGNLYATGKLRTTGLNDDGFVWKIASSNGVASSSWVNPSSLGAVVPKNRRASFTFAWMTSFDRKIATGSVAISRKPV